MASLPRPIRNALFYAIIFVSGLLSLVSVVVVLELHGASSPPADVSAARFTRSLTTMHRLVKERHAAPLPRTDTATIRAAAAAAAAVPARGAAPDARTQAQVQLALYRREEALVNHWEARTTSVIADLEQLAAGAMDAYEIEAGRPGIPERESRFMELRAWYQAEAHKVNAYLDSGRFALASANVALASLRDPGLNANAPALADSARARLARAEVLVARPPSFASFRPRGAPMPPAAPDISTDAAGADAAPADAAGEGPALQWLRHPITSLSSWLRNERSLELASLIGMLGFGLLGAAASTVVRRKKEAETAGTADYAISDNLSNLLLSGVSASLATYLSVRGGLAVVSSDGAVPNPYLLLLTCFVAAVYWEEAWERVRAAISKENQPPQGEPAPAENQPPGAGGGENPAGDGPVPPVQPRAEENVVPDGAGGRINVGNLPLVDAPVGGQEGAAAPAGQEQEMDRAAADGHELEPVAAGDTPVPLDEVDEELLKPIAHEHEPPADGPVPS